LVQEPEKKFDEFVQVKTRAQKFQETYTKKKPTQKPAVKVEPVAPKKGEQWWQKVEEK